MASWQDDDDAQGLLAPAPDAHIQHDTFTQNSHRNGRGSLLSFAQISSLGMVRKHKWTCISLVGWLLFVIYISLVSVFGHRIDFLDGVRP